MNLCLPSIKSHHASLIMDIRTRFDMNSFTLLGHIFVSYYEMRWNIRSWIFTTPVPMHFFFSSSMGNGFLKLHTLHGLKGIRIYNLPVIKYFKTKLIGLKQTRVTLGTEYCVLAFLDIKHRRALLEKEIDFSHSVLVMERFVINSRRNWTCEESCPLAYYQQHSNEALFFSQWTECLFTSYRT